MAIYTNKKQSFITVLHSSSNSVNIKEFLRQESIHFTKSNNHTGNADVERLHSTISEICRTLKAMKSPLSTQERVLKE